MGMAQYLQTSICAHAYHAIDRRVNNAALAVSEKRYTQNNFAVWVRRKWFGITYAFITHSHYEPKPMTRK